MDGNSNFFDQIGLGIVKTWVMFMGEVEFSGMGFKHWAEWRHIFIISFTFITVLGIFNLLNGLAVSDIGKLYQEAEMWGLISDIDTIRDIVSIPKKCS